MPSCAANGKRVLMDSAYLPSGTLGDYVREVTTRHPALRSVLDFSRPGAEEAIKSLVSTTTEFDSDETGRGDSYRRAQENATVRWTGTRQLLRLCIPRASARGTVVLDVLGGDGTLARAVIAQAKHAASGLSVLTGDISGSMIERALSHGLPAVRQAAHFLFLRDDSVDAALLAYGTHHIAPADRPAAVREAFRVTRPGGRVVLHDFEDMSPMARFFARVVHTSSKAGHNYLHFSRESLRCVFEQASATASITDVYDPYRVCGTTANDAKRRMCRYIVDMYGITRPLCSEEDLSLFWQTLVDEFDHTGYVAMPAGSADYPRRPVVYRKAGCFVAEVPRVAIVATAEKRP